MRMMCAKEGRMSTSSMDDFLQTVCSAASQARALCSMPEHKDNRLTIARASEMLSEIEYNVRRLAFVTQPHSLIIIPFAHRHGHEPRDEFGAVGEAVIDKGNVQH